MSRPFGWDYPPGVTGNEPEISGEWPCEECGFRFDPDELDEDNLCQECARKREDDDRRSDDE